MARTLSFAATLTIAAVFVMSGCESTEDIMPIEIVPTPLAVDPLDRVDIVGWWQSDERLLQLEARGSYTAFEGDSRYNPVVERGRWGRLSYAHVTLEPYRVLDADSQRWTLTRQNDRLMLVGNGEQFVMLDAPPESIEDHLIGTWSGDRQELLLGSNMRYTWQRTGEATSAGRWRVRSDGGLELTPDLAGMPSIRVAVITSAGTESGGDVTTLVTPRGELTMHDIPSEEKR